MKDYTTGHRCTSMELHIFEMLLSHFLSITSVLPLCLHCWHFNFPLIYNTNPTLRVLRRAVLNSLQPHCLAVVARITVAKRKHLFPIILPLPCIGTVASAVSRLGHPPQTRLPHLVGYLRSSFYLLAITVAKHLRSSKVKA